MTLRLTPLVVCEALARFLAEENVQDAPSEISISYIAKICRDKFDKLNRRTPNNRQDEFCEEVARQAKTIAKRAIRDHSFRAVFEGSDGIRLSLLTSNSATLGSLYGALGRLHDALTPFSRDNAMDPVFTLVLDEVGILMTDETTNDRFFALQRMISVVSNGRKFWYLFLSTKSKLQVMLPPDHAVRQDESSGSWRGGTLSMYPPFTAFAVDVDDLRQGFRFEPAKESLTTFTRLRHMAKFGRPLWAAYERPDTAAERKLIGGAENFNGFRATDRNHVFAAMSVRLCLDVNLSNPITLPLSQAAVNLHLRLVTFMDPATGLLRTRTPSEPIVSYAAMKHLCRGFNWDRALSTFAGELLSLGVIPKGTKGELYSRMILILAHDAIVGRVPAGSEVDNTKIFPTFTVKVFLQSLFASTHHGVLDCIDKEILNAHLNFMMFTQTEEHLTKGSFNALCYSLLRRAAALQLAPHQPTYDHLIPFYCGDPAEAYDPAKAGAILVQVKNKAKASTPADVLGEPFYAGQKARAARKSPKRTSKNRIIFDDAEVKILFIVFDLGVDQRSVSVECSHAEKPRVWAIHSQGHDETIFGCIETMSVKVGADRFFHSAIGRDEEAPIAIRHDADVLKNVLYHDRYPWDEETTDNECQDHDDDDPKGKRPESKGEGHESKKRRRESD